MIFLGKDIACKNLSAGWASWAILRAQYAPKAGALIFFRPNYALAKWQSIAKDDAPSHISRPSLTVIESRTREPVSRVISNQWHGFCTEDAGKAENSAHHRDVAPPPPWKMAIVAAVAIYPLILIIPGFLSSLTGDAPHWLAVLISTLFITPLMTWVVMPGLTRVLRGWLYKGRSRPGDQRSDEQPPAR